MGEIWAKYAYLLNETGKYTVKLKPEVAEACKKQVFKPWTIADAEAFLLEQFGAKKLDDFVSVFGYADDYLSDDVNVKENVYEVSDPVIMAQWMTEEEKRLSIEHHNDVWRFSLRSDANGQIVGFFCPLICSLDLMGYIFLFIGWNLSGDNFKSYRDLEHIDFLVRKGYIKF